jgi:nickel-dependent lactate racemase
MRVRIDYGTRGLDVELPDGICDVITPRHEPGFADEREALRRALGEPSGRGDSPGSIPLAAFVKPADRIGIVFNDITRPTPNHLILPAVLEELKRASVPSNRVTLFCATGTHRANSEAELREILGEEIAGVKRDVNSADSSPPRGLRLRQHDARDLPGHVRLGTTKRGTEVFVDREFMECDAHILTGFIEPHFFAGFSGGPKAIVPGLASIVTVTQNHGPGNLDNPNARWGVTRGNPVWEDIFEAASMVPRVFIVNVALNRERRITRVFAGDMERAHAEGCAFVAKTAMAPVGGEYDIVVTSNSGYPLDMNLYQCVKGMSAASQIVRRGGSIVIAAECRDGVPEHGSFGRLLREARSPESLLAAVRGPEAATDDAWQAHILGLVLEKADVYVYSGGLSEEQARAAGLKPCARVEDTVETLLRRRGRRALGKGARVCVLPEGPQTIPYLAGASGVDDGTKTTNRYT